MTSVEQRLGCARTIAASVVEAGGIEGRVRFQKTMYLLKRLGLQELAGVDYVYYHYGPYSPEVAEVLRECVAGALCIERGDSYDDEWQKYTYAPGPLAEGFAAALSKESRVLVSKVVKRCQAERWRTLELAATIDFVRADERLDFSGAVARALSLKPSCQPYEADAKRVLAELGLAV